MPGKVNPVICEAAIMVAAQVIGNDATIALSSTNGAFELNVGIPVMAANLLQSIRLLANVSRVAAEKMIDGLSANRRALPLPGGSIALDRNPAE